MRIRRLTTLTLDTTVFIRAIDGKPGCEPAQRIFQLSKEGLVALVASNRVFEHDTSNMSQDSQRKLHECMQQHGVQIDPSGHRLGFSLLDGGDVLDGGPSIRTPEEMRRFEKLVGKDPTAEFQGNRTLGNKLGDYDALRDHFASGRDAFITLDTKHYLAVNLRDRYARELGLVVQSPEAFLAGWG